MFSVLRVIQLKISHPYVSVARTQPKFTLDDGFQITIGVLGRHREDPTQCILDLDWCLKIREPSIDIWNERPDFKNNF